MDRLENNYWYVVIAQAITERDNYRENIVLHYVTLHMEPLEYYTKV